MQNILFVVQSKTQYNELQRLAYLLKESDNKVCILFYTENQGIIQKITNDGFRLWQCSIENIVNSTYVSISEKINTSSSKFQKIKLKINRKIEFWVELLVRYPNLYEISRSKGVIESTKVELYKKTIIATNITQVVIAEDGMGGHLHIIKAANYCNVPVFILPYEYSTSKQIKEYLKVFRPELAISNFFTALFLKIFYPNYITHYESKTYLYDDLAILLSYDLAKILPKNIFTVHGGNANVLFAESVVMYEHYFNEGIKGKSILKTGALYDDELNKSMLNFDEIRKQIYTKYNFDITKPLITCSFIPDYTQDRLCEFKNFESLIDFWIDSLQKYKHYNIIYQLHPAISVKHHEYISQKNITIANEPLISIMPITDIFITSVSSTIRWAIICEKPVINYDMYFLKNSDYENNKAVVTVYNKNEYLTILDKILKDAGYRNYLEKLQQTYNKNWAFRDGLCGKRILDAMNNYNKKV